MKKVKWIGAFVALAALVSQQVFAGPPLNNLQGVGGVAFNPLAYTADSSGENSHYKVGDQDILGKPRFGAWYVNLDHANVDWTTIGVAETFFDRVEVSYGYESINQSGAQAIHKNNVGTKLLVLPENSFDTKFLPAVSVGGIYKDTSFRAEDVDSSGYDFYTVATKTITQLPQPVIVSGGLLVTKEKVTGVFGFDKDSAATGFGNVDVVLPYNLVLGYEYKQGARYSDFKNADYWDLHLAWLANNNLSLVLAYVDAGDSKSSKVVGLGNGVVLSTQYAF
ncbi:MAG: DUF3034 family protein [Candidatus Omnitrophota bacterium]